MKKKKAKLRRRRQSRETNRSAIIKARFEWGKNVGPKTKKRWSGKIRGGGGGSPRRALARYAFMARVSNFTCNNETRRDSKEGSDERSGKAAQAYRRWASIDDRGKDARNEIGQRSGERPGGGRGRKMIYVWRRPGACPRRFYDSHAHHSRPRDRRTPL